MIKLDKQRELFVNEIKRMEESIKKTKSEKLKADYTKGIRRMKKQLKIYDNYRKQAEVVEIIK